jgi:hypothetical protein
MMVKNSVKAVQRRLDRFQAHQEYLQMLDGEALFLKNCGVNTDDVRGAGMSNAPNISMLDPLLNISLL